MGGSNRVSGLMKGPRDIQGFKDGAVQHWITSGQSAEEGARGLGVTTWNLRRWMVEALKAMDGKAAPVAERKPGKMEADLRRLRKELWETREQRDILKKAVIFSARRASEGRIDEGPRRRRRTRRERDSQNVAGPSVRFMPATAGKAGDARAGRRGLQRAHWAHSLPEPGDVWKSKDPARTGPRRHAPHPSAASTSASASAPRAHQRPSMLRWRAAEAEAEESSCCATLFAVGPVPGGLHWRGASIT